MRFTHEQVARVIHEANRAVQQIVGDPAPSSEWATSSWRERQATTQGVYRALEGRTPQQLHQDWCDHKVAHGWRFGPVKSEQARTHPCLVPYEDLPMEQRIKDEIFLAIADILAPHVQVPRRANAAGGSVGLLHERL
ncbi:RyR domain-containing protein [Streptomyces sp. NEAU-Y11]|uniref:RyR domain-containing protein n=1 Tax=Streptomyces cucumeris TaxID=2962890 RepID=UPI0035AC117E